MSENTAPEGAKRGLSRRAVLATTGAASVLGALTLAGCTSEKAAVASDKPAGNNASGPQKGKKVVMVVHDTNPFFAPVKAGFEAFAAAAGWTAQWVEPKSGAIPDVVAAQQNAIASKPDGIIITRIDPTAFDDNIKKAKADGISVVLSNVASEGYKALGVGFVGQEFVAAGNVCGQEIAKYAATKLGRKDGIIVCGNGAPGNSALEARIEGTKQGVAAYNKANGTNFEAQTFVSAFDANEAIGKISAKYTADGDKIAGWAMSAFDHQFVAEWAQQKNLVNKFAIGGFDLIKPVLDLIEKGEIDFSLGQNPYAQGWIAASLLAMEIDPGYPAYDYDTGAEVVDKSNIAAVQKREAVFA
ncbi:MAG TPA: substrate-binding domain-containing protein [Candidatus Lumbricidophila sp.]|nr:substrate-binding domain-containing protein [Candidatus Lumbricidophila sp.]